MVTLDVQDKMVAMAAKQTKFYTIFYFFFIAQS